MKKILLYIPDPLDGVSRYRAWGPISALQREGKVQATAFPNGDAEVTHWTWPYNYDLCLMSRPHLFQHKVFVEQAKKHGMKIWIDMDDAVFHLPLFNKAYRTIGKQIPQEMLKFCLQNADLVSVSSKMHGDWLKKNIGINRLVYIPNALDERLLYFKREFQWSKNILWRGSDSHLQDVLEYSGAIMQVSQKNPDWDFLFNGTALYSAFLGGKNIQYAIESNFADFYETSRQFKPSITHVPLHDSFFNRVKSNLGWIDATLAGSVCLGPNWEEWQVPGMTHYKDESDYATQLQNLMHCGEEKLKKLYLESYNYIAQNLMLSDVNLIRENIIRGDYF